MQKTSTLAIAAALAAFTGTAIAQDATTPSATQMPPATTAPAAPATDPAMPATDGTAQAPATPANPAMPDSGVAQTPSTATGTDMAATSTEPFVQMQQEGQYLGSRLMGANVVSAADEDIGDVNDVLFDKDGRGVAILVGVGGFLGIGEKDVAIPFNRLTIEADTDDGEVANAADAVDNIRVSLETTREELEAAPAFERLEDDAMTGATTEGVTPTDGTTVLPTTPNVDGGTSTTTTPSTAQ